MRPSDRRITRSEPNGRRSTKSRPSGRTNKARLIYCFSLSFLCLYSFLIIPFYKGNGNLIRMVIKHVCCKTSSALLSLTILLRHPLTAIRFHGVNKLDNSTRVVNCGEHRPETNALSAIAIHARDAFGPTVAKNKHHREKKKKKKRNLLPSPCLPSPLPGPITIVKRQPSALVCSCGLMLLMAIAQPSAALESPPGRRLWR